MPQGLPNKYYIENYSSIHSIITAFQLNKVYSSIIFRVLISFFIVNLVGCTLKILPGQIVRMDKNYYPKVINDSDNLLGEGLDLDDFKDTLYNNRFKILDKDNGFVAYKHKIGNLGSTITHLGIVIIIIGGFFGNLLDKEGFVNLLPGDSKVFEDNGFSIVLDDFYLDFRDDGSTEQYYSHITILEDNKEIKKDKMWVNKPIKYKRLNLYQSSYGWASKLNIHDNENNLLYEHLLRNMESYFYQPLHLTVYLYGYYPDLYIGDEGEPFSMTEKENNPYYAVMLYHYNQNVGSYVLEPNEAIEYEGLKISFSNSTLYTGITYTTDYGYVFILIGSLFLLIGLVVSFYFYPKFVIVEEGSIKIAVRQNRWGFTHMIKNYIKETYRKGENKWI